MNVEMGEPVESGRQFSEDGGIVSVMYKLVFDVGGGLNGIWGLMSAAFLCCMCVRRKEIRRASTPPEIYT